MRMIEIRNPIQINKTKVRTAYNSMIERAANGSGECPAEHEEIGYSDLELKIELAKMEYKILFA